MVKLARKRKTFLLKKIFVESCSGQSIRTRGDKFQGYFHPDTIHCRRRMISTILFSFRATIAQQIMKN